MERTPNKYWDRLIQEAYEDGQRVGYVKSFILYLFIMGFFALIQRM